MGQAVLTTAETFERRLSSIPPQTGRKHSLLFSLFLAALLGGQARVALAYEINGRSKGGLGAI